MLDTVRQYALELDAGDVRDRHARYFTELAERLGPELIGPRRVVAMSEVAAEHDNLLAALAFDVERGFRIVAALRSYWTTATRGREIQAWLEGAFAAADSVGTESRIGALLVLGRQLMNQGEYDVARVTLERVVAAAKELDCWSVASTALGYLAWLSAVAHDDEGCRQLAEEAIELGRRGSDRWAERQGLAMVAATLIDRGEYAAAMDYLSESLAIARELDDPSTTVLALVNRSYGAIAAGDHALARPLLEEALELARGLDEPPSMVSVLHLLAWEASVARDPERTRRFLHDALELLQAGGRTSQIVDVLSETALALEASDPETAARLLAAADASAPARGIPATERYGPLRERLAGHSATAVAPHDAVRDALVALD
jgi:tetratricopeptide (TPR) repeat protein